MGKVVLITGCNSTTGIGYSTVKELLKDNCYIVYATVKSPDKASDLEELAKVYPNLLIRYLDLTAESTIKKLITEIIYTQGQLDILVNNAGYGLIGAIEEVSIEQAREEYESNLFGTVRLIQEVLPYFRKQKFGHIINVSTVFCHVLSMPFAGFYIGTKAALEKITESLALELSPWNIVATNFLPGPVKTSLSKKFGNRMDMGNSPYTPYRNVIQKIVDTRVYSEMATDSAAAIKLIIENRNPPINYYSVERIKNYAKIYSLNIENELQELKSLFNS